MRTKTISTKGMRTKTINAKGMRTKTINAKGMRTKTINTKGMRTKTIRTKGMRTFFPNATTLVMHKGGLPVHMSGLPLSPSEGPGYSKILLRPVLPPGSPPLGGGTPEDSVMKCHPENNCVPHEAHLYLSMRAKTIYTISILPLTANKSIFDCFLNPTFRPRWPHNSEGPDPGMRQSWLTLRPFHWPSAPARQGGRSCRCRRTRPRTCSRTRGCSQCTCQRSGTGIHPRCKNQRAPGRTLNRTKHGGYLRLVCLWACAPGRQVRLLSRNQSLHLHQNLGLWSIHWR